MPNLRGYAAEDQVADQAMAVGRHGDQVAMLAFGQVDDVVGRFSAGELGVDCEAFVG